MRQLRLTDYIPFVLSVLPVAGLSGSGLNPTIMRIGAKNLTSGRNPLLGENREGSGPCQIYAVHPASFSASTSAVAATLTWSSWGCSRPTWIPSSDRELSGGGTTFMLQPDHSKMCCSMFDVRATSGNPPPNGITSALVSRKFVSKSLSFLASSAERHLGASLASSLNRSNWDCSASALAAADFARASSTIASPATLALFPARISPQTPTTIRKSESKVTPLMYQGSGIQKASMVSTANPTTTRNPKRCSIFDHLSYLESGSFSLLSAVVIRRKGKVVSRSWIEHAAGTSGRTHGADLAGRLGGQSRPDQRECVLREQRSITWRVLKPPSGSRLPIVDPLQALDHRIKISDYMP